MYVFLHHLSTRVTLCVRPQRNGPVVDVVLATVKVSVHPQYVLTSDVTQRGNDMIGAFISEYALHITDSLGEKFNGDVNGCRRRQREQRD